MIGRHRDDPLTCTAHVLAKENTIDPAIAGEIRPLSDHRRRILSRDTQKKRVDEIKEHVCGVFLSLCSFIMISLLM